VVAMSYYYTHEFKFSTHGLQRIKQRLKIQHLDDFAAKNYVIKLLDNVGNQFEDRDNLYYQVAGQNLYFVIKKSDKVIVTLTPMTPEKLLSIYEHD
jgi:hypothetical protein